jgi:hypothetical protein
LSPIRPGDPFRIRIVRFDPGPSPAVLAFLCLILGEGWRAYPFIMLILLAGLQAIPRQLYDRRDRRRDASAVPRLHHTA